MLLVYGFYVGNFDEENAEVLESTQFRGTDASKKLKELNLVVVPSGDCGNPDYYLTIPKVKQPKNTMFSRGAIITGKDFTRPSDTELESRMKQACKFLQWEYEKPEWLIVERYH